MHHLTKNATTTPQKSASSINWKVFAELELGLYVDVDAGIPYIIPAEIDTKPL